MSHALLALLLAAPPGPVAQVPWDYDEVFLLNGAHFRGLIVAESPEGVRFRVVRRNPGRPTVTLTTLITPGETARVQRLGDAARTELVARLAALDPDGSGERSRMQDLPLTASEWPGGGPALAYQSDQFSLTSNAPDEVTRRAAVRLEQIFAAYARFLPARLGRGATRVLFAGTRAGYRAALQTMVGPAAAGVANPAVFDPAANRIVGGSDLMPIAEDLSAARLAHAAGRARLDAADAELKRLYKTSPAELERFLAGTRAERDKLTTADRANDAAFDAAIDRMLTPLYHEAFHAYAAAAYPDPGLPRWLNEGLAQIFETAVVEAGELRVGHADADRLDRARLLLTAKGERLVPVEAILRAGGDSFLAAHAAGRARTDRAYLTAWLLTFYLTFERHQLGGAAFERYLNEAPLNPVRAFETWVAQDLPAFERDFLSYAAKLRADGTAAPR